MEKQGIEPRTRLAASSKRRRDAPSFTRMLCAITYSKTKEQGQALFFRFGAGDGNQNPELALRRVQKEGAMRLL
jgi:hypothetical protein